MLAPAGSRAEASGNGLVDGADLTLWRENFGAGGAIAAAVYRSRPSSTTVDAALHQQTLDAIHAGGDFTQLFVSEGGVVSKRGLRPVRRAALVL